MSDPLEPIFEHIHRTPAPPGRPFVTLSYAQSLDGSIAREAGHRYALSGPESQAFTHRLRACHPSILLPSFALPCPSRPAGWPGRVPSTVLAGGNCRGSTSLSGLPVGRT